MMESDHLAETVFVSDCVPRLSLPSNQGVPRVLAVGCSSRDTPVLTLRDQNRLQRPELAELVEFILVGNQTWRPELPEVIRRVQQLIESSGHQVTQKAKA